MSLRLTASNAVPHVKSVPTQATQIASALLALALLLVGCSDTDITVPVHGTVSFPDGTVPEGCRLFFQPLDVAGAISLPLDREHLRFDVSLKGDQLAGLAPLLRRSLPPLGPYAIAGQLSVSGDQFTMDKVNARIGNSTMRGNLSLYTKGARPKLNANVRADR